MLLNAPVADARDSRSAHGSEGDVYCHVGWLGGRVATRGCVGSRGKKGTVLCIVTVARLWPPNQ